jgi:hypothetical protein
MAEVQPQVADLVQQKSVSFVESPDVVTQLDGRSRVQPQLMQGYQFGVNMPYASTSPLAFLPPDLAGSVPATAVDLQHLQQMQNIQLLQQYQQQQLADQASKKKVGRPSKKPQTESFTINGIVNERTDANNKIELVFQHSNFLKQIAVICKHISLTEIPLQFNLDDINMTFYAREQHIAIYASINATNCVSYYCAEPAKIVVGRKRLEEVFSAGSKKNAPPVTISVRDNTYDRKMYVNIKDNGSKTQDMMPIDLLPLTDVVDHWGGEPESDTYPLHFEIPTAMLKAFISGIRSPTVTVNFEMEQPGVITMSLYESQITRKKTFSDSDIIKLQTTLTDDDIISVAVFIVHIKPFVSAKLSDTIKIAVHPTLPLMMMYENDAYTIKQYIKLATIDAQIQ